MKRIYLLLILNCLTLINNAQVPQGINYQAVARNASGLPITEKQITIRIEITNNIAEGELIYSETHSVLTNDIGMFNLVIGKGTPLNNFNFSKIDWGIGGNKWLSIYVDIEGGTNFLLIGSSQLLSVPYAFYSEKTKTNLPPLMTEQERDAIVNPQQGMEIINVNTGCINYYYVSNWYESCGVCIPQPTKADAGTDQLIQTGTVTTLAANTPVKGTGQWSIISGEGGNINNTASPTSTFTGKAETKYILRWAITTSCGVSADTVVIWFWSCGVAITDLRDAKIYQTVIIGSQCWMKQNLNIGTRIDGNVDQANNSIIEKYCSNNNEGYCNVYGGLYQWDEMMQYLETEGTKGICPTGWHIPSDGEWKQLEMYLGMSQSDADKYGYRGTDEAGKLKETGTAHWKSPNTGATNSSGFTALPGGYRDTDASFGKVGSVASFWTSSPTGSGNAWVHDLYYADSLVGRNGYGRLVGFSVRCVMD